MGKGKKNRSQRKNLKTQAGGGVVVPAAFADAFGFSPTLPAIPEGMDPVIYAIQRKHLGLFVTHLSAIPAPLDDDLLDHLLKALYSEYMAIADRHDLRALFSLEYTFILNALKKIISLASTLSTVQTGFLIHILIPTLHDLTSLLPTSAETFFKEHLYKQIYELINNALTRLCIRETGPHFSLLCGTSKEFTEDHTDHFCIEVVNILPIDRITLEGIHAHSPDEFKLVLSNHPERKTSDLIFILQDHNLSAICNMMLSLNCLYQIKRAAWLAERSKHSETVREILNPLMNKLAAANPTLEESNKETVFELFLAVKGHDFIHFKKLYSLDQLRTVDLIAGFCSVDQSGFAMTLILFSQHMVRKAHRRFMRAYQEIDSLHARASHPYKKFLSDAYDACQIALFVLSTTPHLFLIKKYPDTLQDDLNYLALNNQDCSSGETPHADTCYTQQLLSRYQSTLQLMLQKIAGSLTAAQKRLRETAHVMLGNLAKLHLHFNLSYEITETQTIVYIPRATPVEIVPIQHPQLTIQLIHKEEKIEDMLSITAPLELGLDNTLYAIEQLVIARGRIQEGLDLAKEEFSLPAKIREFESVKKLLPLQEKKLAHLFFNIRYAHQEPVCIIYAELKECLDPEIHYALLNEAFFALHEKHEIVINSMSDYTHPYKKSLYFAHHALSIFIFLQEHIFLFPPDICQSWINQAPWNDSSAMDAHVHHCPHTLCEVNDLLASYQQNLSQLFKVITGKAAMSSCAGKNLIQSTEIKSAKWVITINQGTEADYLALKSLEQEALFHIVYKKQARSLKLIEPLTTCHLYTLHALLTITQHRAERENRRTQRIYALLSRVIAEFSTRSTVILSQLPLLCMAFTATFDEFHDLSTLLEIGEAHILHLKEITLDYDLQSHSMTLEAPEKVLSEFFKFSQSHYKNAESAIMTPQHYFNCPVHEVMLNPVEI